MPLVLAMLLALSGAATGGESTDVEILRPTFSPAGVPGVDDPEVGRQFTWRFGTLVQYASDPLVLYEWSDRVGAVVENRVTAQLGFSYDLERRFSMRLVLPMAIQWGTELPALGADGAGLGDASVGLRWIALQGRDSALGARADILLPTGRNDHWLGETQPRLLLGAVGSHRTGRVAFLADLGLVARSQVDADHDFVLGSELALAAAARVDVVDWLDLSAALHTRTGLERFLAGGAVTSLEPVAAAHLAPGEHVELTLGVGTGLGGGYGTTAFRVLGGLTVTAPGPVPPPEPTAALIAGDDLPDVVISRVEAPEPVAEEAPWEEGQVARVEDDAIAVREPIQFELNTARILPDSLPTLRAVARLLNEDGRIGHLLVEGHASEEGDYDWNYELSMLRAQAIWKELVVAGVHPARLSARGMGEVVPRRQGGDEAALAANRRVEFQIVYRLEPGEDHPVPPYRVRLPWTGEAARVGWPLPPEPVDEDDYTRSFEDMDVEAELELLLAPEPDEEEEP